MNKFIAILFVLLLGPIFFLNFLTVSFKQGVREDFLKQELAKFNVYELAFAKLPEFLNAEGVSEGGAAVSSAEAEAIIKKVLTPADLKEIIEAAIDGKGDPAKTNAQITQKLNQKMKPYFEPMLADLPVCGGGEEVVCKPAGADFDATMAHLSKNGNLTGTPMDSLVMVTAPTQTKTEKSGLPGFGFLSQFSFLKYASWITLAAILVLVILLSRLFSGAWKKIFLPFGSFLLVYAGGSFLSGYLLLKVFLPLITKAVPLGASLKSDFLTPFFRDMAVATGRTLNQNILILAITAGTFIILGIIINVATKPKTEPVAQEAKTPPAAKPAPEVKKEK